MTVSRPRPYQVSMNVEFYDLMAMERFLRQQGFDREFVESHLRQVPAVQGEHRMIDRPGSTVVLRNVDIGGGRSNPR